MCPINSEKEIDDGEAKHLSSKIDVLNNDQQYRASTSVEKSSKHNPRPQEKEPKLDYLIATDIRQWLTDNINHNDKQPTNHNDFSNEIITCAKNIREEDIDNENKSRDRNRCNLKRSCENRIIAKKSTECKVNMKNSRNKMGTNIKQSNEEIKINSNKSREQSKVNEINTREESMDIKNRSSESKTNGNKGSKSRRNVNRSHENKVYENRVCDNQSLTKRQSKPKQLNMIPDERIIENTQHKIKSELYTNDRKRGHKNRESNTLILDDYELDNNSDESDVYKQHTWDTQRQQQQLQHQNYAEWRQICTDNCPLYVKGQIQIDDNKISLPTTNPNRNEKDDRSLIRKEERKQRWEEKMVANIRQAEDDIARMETESSDILRCIKYHHRAQQQLKIKHEQLQLRIDINKEKLLALESQTYTGRSQLQKQKQERSQQKLEQETPILEQDESASQIGAQRSMSVIINVNLSCHKSKHPSTKFDAGTITTLQRAHHNSTKLNYTSLPYVSVRTRRHHVYKQRNLR